ncbi:MAG: hypothetical protein ACRDN0_10130 [Trebonia sp.]
MAPSSTVPRDAPSPRARPADAPPGSSAGQRLCAWAYLNREFRDQVLRDVYSARARLVAPSHGFDVVPVLRHAWRAWWLETGACLLTLAVFGVGFVLVPLDTLITVDLLVIWGLLRVWLRWVREFVGYGEPLNSPGLDQVDLPRDRRLRLNGRLLKYSLVFSLAVLLMLVLMSAVSGPGGSLPARLEDTGLGVTVIAAATAAVVALGAGADAFCLARSQLAATMPGRVGRRMRSIDQQQHHPVVVHTGHKPFVGSGNQVRSWSFAQRLVRAPADQPAPGPGQEFDRPPFSAQKLIDRLRQSILDLRDDRDPETELPGLRVADEVFVDSAYATAPDLASALTANADADAVNSAIARAIANPGDVARHYLAVRVESWGGHIVTSVFVHVSLQGRTLYLEFATYALFPVKVEPGAPAVPAAIGAVLARLPERLLASWRIVRLPALFLPALRRGGAGTDTSLREAMMMDAEVRFREEPERSYFQVQDVAQHSKIIERRLIAAVDEFLFEVGVDTSEFTARTTQILNTGVMNFGSGDVNVENSAVGPNATAAAQ